MIRPTLKAPRVSRVSYGPAVDHYGDLHLGHGAQSRGCVVLIHGGFWRAHRGLEMTTPAARALAARGWDVWNIEYRRACDWRGTLDDCRRAFAHLGVLSQRNPIDRSTTLIVGHSAGGQLAGWLAGQVAESSELHGLVTLNGVLDLGLAHRLRIGDAAVAEFLGPDIRPEIIAEADPAAHPAHLPTRCLHSRADERVPHEISAGYVAKARLAAIPAALVDVTGHHTAVIEPDSPAWPTVLDAVEEPWGPATRNSKSEGPQQ